MTPYSTIIQIIERDFSQGTEPKDSIKNLIELFKKNDVQNPILAERLTAVQGFIGNLADFKTSAFGIIVQLKNRYELNYNPKTDK